MKLRDFSRKPYPVTYKDFHSGALTTVLRRPPPKNHDFLPTDLVELNTAKNADWPAGKEVAIKHISYRAPNTLQLSNDEGLTTFVGSSEVTLVKEEAYRQRPTLDDEQANGYLLWP